MPSKKVAAKLKLSENAKMGTLLRQFFSKLGHFLKNISIFFIKFITTLLNKELKNDGMRFKKSEAVITGGVSPMLNV